MRSTEDLRILANVLAELDDPEFLLDLSSLMDIAVQLTRAQFHGETTSPERVQHAFSAHLNFVSKISLTTIKDFIGEQEYKEILDKIL